MHFKTACTLAHATQISEVHISCRQLLLMEANYAESAKITFLITFIGDFEV